MTTTESKVEVQSAPGWAWALLIVICLLLAITGGISSCTERRAEEAKKAAAAQRQADNQRRRDEAVRIADRARVEQGIAGEWSNGPSWLTITKGGDTFRAEYPSTMGLQVLSGKLQTDNQLRLGNVKQLGKIVNPLTFYQGDFDQEAWIELGVDGSFLIVRFSQAKGGRSIVMNRTDGNHREHKAAETLAPKPAPVVAPESAPETDAQFWKRVTTARDLDKALRNATETMRFYHLQERLKRGEKLE